MPALHRREWSEDESDRDDGFGQRGGRSSDQEWDDEPPRRRRRGPIRRLFSLLKLCLFLAPLALFLYGSVFADCRARPSFSDWGSVLGASACARSEMIGNAFSVKDNFEILKRLID